MAVPTFGSSGAAVGASTGITPAYPATVNNNDIAIVVVETANQPVTFPAGWTQIAAPGVGVAGALDAECVQAAWRRCDGTEGGTTISIADAGDHQGARIFTIVGCPISGDPVDVFASNTNGTASTSYSAPGVTTTVTDTLVVAVIGRSNDSSVTTSFSGEANADLANLTEQFEWGTGTGNGGGGVVITGEKATAGAVGATTTTGPSATQAAITFALKSTTSSGGSSSFTLTADQGSFSYTGQAANLTYGRSMAAALGTFSYTGQDAALSKGYLLTAAVGAFTYTGQAALLTAARSLTAAQGAFSYTGQAAALTLAQTMPAVAGSFSYTGQAANLSAAVNTSMPAAVGTFSYSGQIATLRTGASIVATAGIYSYTGYAARALLNMAQFPAGSGGGSGGPKVSAMFYR